MPIMTTVLDYDTWAEKYKPITNAFAERGFDGTMFETYGEEEEYIYNKHFQYVWTFSSEEQDTITNGRGYVNRVGYFVTEVPWHEDDKIVVDLYSEES